MRKLAIAALIGLGCVSVPSAFAEQGVAECTTGHAYNLQNPPSSPMPDRFNLNPTVDYATWAAGLQSTYAGCVRNGVTWCTTGHVGSVTNPPTGPLPDRFDFNPTVDWASYQVTFAGHYVNCALLVGSS